MLAVALAQNLPDALSFAFGMFWEILWALILGFALSDAVQAVVSKQEMRRLLPDDSPRSLARATVLGAASSSCSYAAVALARSLFRKGADFTAAQEADFVRGSRQRATSRPTAPPTPRARLRGRDDLGRPSQSTWPSSGGIPRRTLTVAG